jgi:hypothetical protein
MRLSIHVLLLLFTCYHSSAGWWSIPATNLNATITACSVRPYAEGDSKGVDAYMLWAYRVGQPCNTSGSNSIITSLVSPVTFQSGIPYYVWVKLLAYSDAKIGFHVGNGFLNNTTTLSDNDYDDLYTRIGPITSSTTSTNFAIQCYLTNATDTAAKYLLQGVYITTNVNEAIPRQGFDMILTFDAASSAATDVTVPGNWVPNSSFEVGTTAQGWTAYDASSDSHDSSLKATWDGTTAARGTHSLKVSNRLIFYSPYFRVPDANRLFSASFFAKSSSTALDQNRPEFTIQNIQLTNSAYGFTSRTQTWSFTPVVTTNWGRFTLSGFPLWDYPDSYFQIRIFPQSKSLATATNYSTVWIDGIQVNQGPAVTVYEPLFPIEAGIFVEPLGNAFLPGDTKEVHIVSFNNTSASSNIVCRYEVRNVYNTVVQSGTPTLTFPVGSGTNTIALTFTNLGPYRMLFWGANSDADETSFSFIVTDGDTGKATNDWIGVHANPTTYAMQLHKRLGFTWVRGLSPASLFRWVSTQPTSSNSYTWGNLTNRILNIDTNNMELMATMNNGTSSGSDVPAWAKALGNPPPVGYWSNWVYTTVNTYKDRVHYWEFWNEPQGAFPSSSALTNYAVNFVDAVYAADPTAKIIYFGGIHSTNQGTEMFAALDSTRRSRIYAYSMHCYPPPDTLSMGPNNYVSAALQPWQSWRDAQLSPTNVWNTESGNQFWGGFQKGNDSEFNLYGETVLAQERSTRYSDAAINYVDQLYFQAIRSVGNGFKFFQYDSRDSSPENQGYNLSTTHTGLESYEAMKPHMYYMGALNFRLKGMTPGFIGFTNSNVATVEGWYFWNSGTNLVAILNTDFTNRTLTHVDFASATQYDAEWNPVTRADPTKVSLTRRPTFLWTTSLTTNQLITAVKAATSVNVADATAPNASIDWSPNGQITTNDWVTLKAYGQDDTYFPNLTGNGLTNLLARRKLIGRDSDYTAWGQETLETFSASTLTTNVTYQWAVQFRDAEGNIGSATGPNFFLSEGITPPPSTNDPPIVVTGKVILRRSVNLRTLP